MAKEKKSSQYQERVRIGAQLLSSMLMRGYTYEQVAEMTGLKVATVQKIMDGMYNVGIDELTSIADVLGIKLNLE